MNATQTLTTSTTLDRVLTITLQRPEVLNSLTDDLLDAITDQLRDAANDNEVRAVVISGAGRGFCAGQDLNTTDGKGANVRAHLRDHYVPLITTIRELDKPVIAAVNGVAAGTGLSLALACDLRVAAESATFICAFVRIGLAPDAGASYFLPRLVGAGRAAELALLGKSVDAAKALNIGLISKVVADEDLASAAQELAARLARGPHSLGLTKRLLNQSLSNDLATQLKLEEDAQVEAAASSDFTEGVSAFKERRPASFRGR